MSAQDSPYTEPQSGISLDEIRKLILIGIFFWAVIRSLNGTKTSSPSDVAVVDPASPVANSVIPRVTSTPLLMNGSLTSGSGRPLLINDLLANRSTIPSPERPLSICSRPVILQPWQREGAIELARQYYSQSNQVSMSAVLLNYLAEGPSLDDAVPSGRACWYPEETKRRRSSYFESMVSMARAMHWLDSVMPRLYAGCPADGNPLEFRLPSPRKDTEGSRSTKKRTRYETTPSSSDTNDSANGNVEIL